MTKEFKGKTKKQVEAIVMKKLSNAKSAEEAQQILSEWNKFLGTKK